MNIILNRLLKKDFWFLVYAKSQYWFLQKRIAAGDPPMMKKTLCIRIQTASHISLVIRLTASFSPVNWHPAAPPAYGEGAAGWLQRGTKKHIHRGAVYVRCWMHNNRLISSCTHPGNRIFHTWSFAWNHATTAARLIQGEGRSTQIHFWFLAGVLNKPWLWGLRIRICICTCVLQQYSLVFAAVETHGTNASKVLQKSKF
jgi:hypothetical protein